MTISTLPVLKAKSHAQYYITRRLARVMEGLKKNARPTRASTIYQGDLTRQFINRVLMAVIHEEKQVTREDVVSMLVRFQPANAVRKLGFDELLEEAKKVELFDFDDNDICQVTESTKELIERFRLYYSKADDVSEMIQNLTFMASVIHSGVGFSKEPAEGSRVMNIAMYNGEWVRLLDHCEDIEASFGYLIELGIYIESPDSPGYYQFSAKAMDILTVFDPNEQ